ncbi:MAG: hypothetical protein G01um101418_211 [Parcubacteria group bacterium Gr01-1014_18]|nr:MAG: hypothetical protein Greene041636_179 [Parcubacteria group bacterium Greene0416_36]TSC81371.1 MAG: hypothetical protein G01um101418_211 [Parcubacteria group bacterium Gr01-1014_18]TSC99443.1 MAG: hypothetical protein Greene101420_110 [Parcubacteria group bacterium Greene1014_20]TSD07638.1 MAG: hypothetical protein Greene07142_95 [Parcubacteria group bacterium Greene0714_2]
MRFFPPKSLISPIFVAFFLFVIFLMWTHFKNRESSDLIAIDWYGTSLGVSTAHEEASLLGLKKHFGRDVKIQFHYISKLGESGKFESVLAGGQESSAELDRDILENKVKLVFQKYQSDLFADYLRISALTLDYTWKNRLPFLNEDDFEISWRLGREGESLLRQEWLDFEEIRAELNLPDTAFSLLLVDGRPYFGKIELLALSSMIARQNFPNSSNAEYNYKGIPLCYDHSQCREFPDLEGICASRHCQYYGAPEIKLNILDDSLPRSAAVISAMRKRHPELDSVFWQEPDAKDIRQKTGIKSGPVYWLSDTLRDSVLFGRYLDNNEVEIVGGLIVLKELRIE